MAVSREYEIEQELDRLRGLVDWAFRVVTNVHLSSDGTLPERALMAVGEIHGSLRTEANRISAMRHQGKAVT